MNNQNPDAFFDGEFYEENSFLVLAKGNDFEHSDSGSPNSSLVPGAAGGSKTNVCVGGNGSMGTSCAIPTPLPRSSAGLQNQNENKSIGEPVSSHFGSLSARKDNNGAPAGEVSKEGTSTEMKKAVFDQPEVSLASVISSNSSVTGSEIESLEESLKLIHILKTENEGLKEMIAQRNETLRDEIKSIHSSSAMYESKHADQLQKYEACMKAISELKAENTKLKEQLIQTEQKAVAVDNSAEILKLKEQISEQNKSFQNEIQRYVDKVDDCKANIVKLNVEINARKAETELLQQQRDALQFDLTDARITIANLSDELKKYKGQQGNSSMMMSTNHLESALQTARQHLTNMKEDNDRKAGIITALSDQKQFCEAQMKEFEANFKEERDEKNKLAETLSVLQIELEKVKADLARKTEELEKLHQTHLVLANEHLNRNRDRTVPTPSGPNEFVFVSGQAPRNEQVQTNANSASPPTAPLTNSPAPAGAMASAAASANAPPPPQQSQEVPAGTCPLCYKRFASVSQVMRHAALCGTTLTPGTNPFLFPVAD